MRKKEGNSRLYAEVASLSLPLALQNIFQTAVSSADVIMVGNVSQDALSAVSLAGQIQFVLNLIFVGLTLGTSVLAAQYWGKGDGDAVERILGLALKTGMLIAGVFTGFACLFPGLLMRAFTGDEILIGHGVRYLRMVGVSYLFMAFSSVYQSVMKAAGKVRKSTLIASSALILNVLLNALFLFGWLGVPRMGVVGVALGTLLARLVELVWCIAESLSGGGIRICPGYMNFRDRELVKDFWKYALPITLNGLSWGSAFAMYSVIMGHLGSDVVAANSLASVARNFAMVGCGGLAGGGGIYLGTLMGKGELDEAKKAAPLIVRMTLLLAVVGGLLILAASPFMRLTADLSPAAEKYLLVMLWINSYYVVGKALNCVANNGIFCAGGDTRFGLICDTIDMWFFAVPLGFICAFVLHLPPMAVYFVICLDEFVKLPFVYRRYKSYKWLRNITR